ncbi:MAG: hypothetical protein H7070_12475, partial [Saprospiraceae bacterium]|nr:hypothetical protein [Pyrinomonadaceae bacterium]
MKIITYCITLVIWVSFSAPIFAGIGSTGEMAGNALSDDPAVAASAI